MVSSNGLSPIQFQDHSLNYSGVVAPQKFAYYNIEAETFLRS